jgi:DTW domain-containing protein YfiP
MKPVLCLCAHLVPRVGRHRVHVVVHETELMKSTNSGRLLPLLWRDASLVVYGNGAPNLPEKFWGDDTRPLVLFPLAGAPTIDTVADVPATPDAPGARDDANVDARTERDPRPFSLIVLDGTWHQANRLRKRFHHARVPFVRLPERARPTLYRLRRGHFDASVSTLEAAAEALSILELDDAVVEHLVDGFRRMQDRTLWLRGAIGADDVYGGVPPGLKRHAVNAALNVADADAVQDDVDDNGDVDETDDDVTAGA